MVVNTVVGNLKIFKKKINKSNDVIGSETGFSRNSVQRYMSGEADPPTEFLQKLHDIYDLNIDWLFSGNGEMFKNEISYMTNVPEYMAAEPKVGYFSRWVDALVAAYPRFKKEDQQEIDNFLKRFFTAK